MRFSLNKYYQKNHKNDSKIERSGRYYSGRSLQNKQQKTSERDELRKLRHRQNLIIKLLSILFVLIGMTSVLVWNFISDVKIEIKYDNTIVANQQKFDRYRQELINYFKKHPLQRFNFALNENDLSNFMVDANPEILNVQQNKFKGPIQASQFIVEFRKPVAMVKINDNNIYVDEFGASFERHNFDQSNIIEIIDKTGAKVNDKQKLVGRQLIKFVGELFYLFKDLGYEINQLSMPPNTIHQIEIRLKDFNFPIKMTIDNPASKQVNGIHQVLSYIKKSQQTIKYLDARLGDKIYYQ